jgi:hypothetical protein
MTTTHTQPVTAVDMTPTEMDQALRSMPPAEHTGIVHYLLGYASDGEYAPSLAVRHALSNAIALQIDTRAEVSK